MAILASRLMAGPAHESVCSVDKCNAKPPLFCVRFFTGKHLVKGNNITVGQIMLCRVHANELRSRLGHLEASAAADYAKARAYALSQRPVQVKDIVKAGRRIESILRR